VKRDIMFLASIPTSKTAIIISGENQTTLKLDIPETEIAEAVKLVLMTGKVLKVTIEEYEDDYYSSVKL